LTLFRFDRRLLLINPGATIQGKEAIARGFLIEEI